MLEQHLKELIQAAKKVLVVLIMIVFVATLAKLLIQWLG